MPVQKRWIIGLARELLMKTPNCIKTGLMTAFHWPSRASQ
jgi:hypothetical protein